MSDWLLAPYFAAAFLCVGYSVIRIFSSSKKTDAGCFDCIELIVLSVVVGLVLNAFVILLLSCFGMLSLKNLFVFHAAAIVFGIFSGNVSGCRPSKGTVSALLLAVIAAGLFFRPVPDIIGGRDPGVYFSTGVNIARTGSLFIKDTSFKHIDKSFYDRNFLYDYEARMFLPGFYLTDYKKGIITPQFYHLYSSVIALFYELGGLKFALYATPFIGLLSILSVFFFLKNFVDEKLGLIVIGMLILTISQVWYSRYLNSEIMVELCCFSAVWLFLKAKKSFSGLFSLAGLVFGLVFFARIDSVLFLPCLLVLSFWILLNPEKIKSTGLFVSVSFLVFLLSQIYAYNCAKVYYVDRFLNKVVSKWPWICVLMLVLFCIGYWLWRNRSRVIKSVNIRAFIVFNAVSLVVFYILSYFLFGYKPADWFIWYLSPLGVIMGLSGFMLLALRNKIDSFEKIAVILFLQVSLLTWFFVYFPAPRIMPDHFWAIRRFSAVALPIMVIGSGYLIYFCMKNRYLKYTGIGLLLVQIAWLIHILIPTINFTGNEGVIDGLSSLKKHVKPQSNIFMFDHKIGLYGTPLYFCNFVDHKMLIPVANRGRLKADSYKFEKMLIEMLDSGEKIYFFDYSAERHSFDKIAVNPYIRIEIPMSRLEFVTDRLPAVTKPIFGLEHNFLYVWRLEKK